MNTRKLMLVASLLPGFAGLFALFVPNALLAWLNVSVTTQLSVLVQLLGVVYFSVALMNWTAKDSAIGGVYARPVSLGNFSHFFIGTLVLAKYLLSNGFKFPVLLLLVVYAGLAIMFYWLVFRATGLKDEK